MRRAIRQLTIVEVGILEQTITNASCWLETPLDTLVQNDVVLIRVRLGQSLPFLQVFRPVILRQLDCFPGPSGIALDGVTVEHQTNRYRARTRKGKLR